MDKYCDFAELSLHEREDEDFERSYRDRESPVLVAAPHAGGIEPYTGWLAARIAREDLSLYCFRGLKQSENRDLHLTSTRFDEPIGVQAATTAQTVLAIHGEQTHEEEFVMVGGLDDAMRDQIAEQLVAGGFSIRQPSSSLAGASRCNICNRGTSGRGVQLEVSRGLRQRLRSDDDLAERFVLAIRVAVAGSARET